MKAAAMRRKVGGATPDDLVMLDKLNQQTIVNCLKKRYMNDIIYTNIGQVLIAINPYVYIPTLYTDACMRQYRGKSYFEMSPHVYSLTDETYRRMTSFCEKQCVIITGESGSGKTETSKIIMQYISSVSGKSVEIQQVKERLLAANPILEAYGNAKTVNNNNSSRFGKYMEILFDVKGDPVGGNVTNYLLEKSRVVCPTRGERNFHIFYMILNYAHPSEKEEFYLLEPQNFRFLYESNCYEVDGIDDRKNYEDFLEGCQRLNISESERKEMIRIISFVLWLGNLEFVENNAEISSVSNRDVLDICAYLLEVNGESLEKSLCYRKIQTGHGMRAETFEKNLKKRDAEFSRDTLAKSLYSKLFDQIVWKINQAVGVNGGSNTNNIGTAGVIDSGFDGLSIGILDIYGFEIFEYNGFEQICINFVNERLQQIFIELTIKQEQEEYVREGIPQEDIDYFNNKPCCDLIDSKPGIFSIMDDCCNTGKDDQMLCGELQNFFSTNQFFRGGTEQFSIRHYAAEVSYYVPGFLAKNKDTLFDDLIEFICSSPCSFVNGHGQDRIEIAASGQKKRPPTVGRIFRIQVDNLMSTLSLSHPHYIRCIKPNHTKRPRDFNDQYIGHQVKYLGLEENVRVRRAGYADRIDYNLFANRYSMLGIQMNTNTNALAGADTRQICQKILEGFGWQDKKEFSLGYSKVFIRTAASVFYLQDQLEQILNESALSIQKAFRVFRQKRYFLKIKQDCQSIMNSGKKERRKQSVDLNYQGDYLNFQYNPLIKGLLSVQRDKHERIIFSTRVRSFPIRSKPNIFRKLLSSIAKQRPFNYRFLMLSDKALYSFDFDQDPNTQQTVVNLHFRIEISRIQSLCTSVYQDNLYIIRFDAALGIRDILQSSPNKTEFIGLLSDMYREVTGGKQLLVKFIGDSTKIEFFNKRRKPATVEVVQQKDISGMVDEDEEVSLSTKESISRYICKIKPGLSSSEISEPARIRDIDPTQSVRPQLRAIKDRKGNNIDELGFNTGDIILVCEDLKDGWYYGELNGIKGYVPQDFVEKISHGIFGVPETQPMESAGSAPPPTSSSLSFTRQQPKQPPTFPQHNPQTEHYTDDGDIYYYNEESGESVWEKPAAFILSQRQQKANEVKAKPVEFNQPKQVNRGFKTPASTRPLHKTPARGGMASAMPRSIGIGIRTPSPRPAISTRTPMRAESRLRSQQPSVYRQRIPTNTNIPKNNNRLPPFSARNRTSVPTSRFPSQNARGGGPPPFRPAAGGRSSNRQPYYR